MTFSKTVEMPGLVLPAGAYTFKDDRTKRNIVRVYNKDETMLLASMIAIGDYRVNPTEKTVVQLREQPSGARPAVHAWFYPNESHGREFVYPK